MKFPGQTKDGVIDNLLRAYVSRPSNPRQGCPDFDPDQANAYIEHSLTDASRSRYELHLSACAACRKNIVALMRLAEADELISASPALPRSGWFDVARRVFGAMSQPQWAMAAAAVIVLAISLPLVISHNWNRPEPVVVATRPPSESPQNALATQQSDTNHSPANRAPAPSVITSSKPHEKKEIDALAINGPVASKPSEAASGIASMTELSKRGEQAAVASQPVDEQRKPEAQVAQGLPQAEAVPSSQDAKNDRDQGRKQAEKDLAQQANEIKTRVDQESTQKEKAGKAEEAVAPPAPVSNSEIGSSRGTLRRSTPKLSLRDSSGETVRADERRISNKKFFFRDGEWTDKDFNPNKDLPVVNVVRDSNVYKELISKRAGLRSIMERFSATERATIVYKGTVYKLIPQPGEK